MCAPAGKLSAGGICTHLISPEKTFISFNEILDMLEAQPERECVPVPGLSVCADNQNGTPQKIPARGAAIIMSAEDWGAMKTELEEACRKLGKRCSYEVRQMILRLNK